MAAYGGQGLRVWEVLSWFLLPRSLTELSDSAKLTGCCHPSSVCRPPHPRYFCLCFSGAEVTGVDCCACLAYVVLEVLRSLGINHLSTLPDSKSSFKRPLTLTGRHSFSFLFTFCFVLWEHFIQSRLTSNLLHSWSWPWIPDPSASISQAGIIDRYGHTTSGLTSRCSWSVIPETFGYVFMLYVFVFVSVWDSF